MTEHIHIPRHPRNIQVRIVGSVMSASLGWDPNRRRREEEEALEQLRKQKEGKVELRTGLRRRGRPVTEREPALEETLKERWRAEVGEDGNDINQRQKNES